MSDDYRTDWSLSLRRYLVYLFVLLTLLMAMSVILGWYTKTEWLIRYRTGTIAMVFNTGLSFSLLAIAIHLIIKQWDKTAILLSTAILILALINLVQHLFHVDLGIDQLFLHHYESYGNLYPGRMAPNTSFNFILLAGALVILARRKSNSLRFYLALTLSLIAMGATLLFLSGYLTQLSRAHAWGIATPMALNTAIIFLCLSFGVVMLISYLAKKQGVHLFAAMPACIGFALLTMTILLAIDIQQIHAGIANKTYLYYIVLIFGTLLTLFISSLLWMIGRLQNAKHKVNNLLSLSQATLESVKEGIIAINLRGQVIAANHGFTQLWRIPKHKLSSFTSTGLIRYLASQITNRAVFLNHISKTNLNKAEDDYCLLHLKNGSKIECRSHPQRLGNRLIGRVWVFRDQTLQFRMEEQLRYQSTHDPLSGLPNRGIMLDLITYALSSSQQNSQMVAIYLLDLDRFSQINDLFGRSKGDVLIKQISERYKRVLHESDVIGRIGGDEFIVIKTIHHQQESYTFAQRLLDVLDKPFHIRDQQLKLTASIGVTIAPLDGDDVDVILTNTDIALSRAKRLGRNNFQFYTRDMNTYSIEQMKLENELKTALDMNQFRLFYQPLYDLKTMRIAGFEALIRWQHPEHGLILPDKFIHLAEDSGMIRGIGDWVLNEACRQAKLWLDQGLDHFRIAVNVSAYQFKYDKFFNKVILALKNHRLSGKYLELELTESLLFDLTDELREMLSELQRQKVHIAIDDFGTGYSCLAYLQTLPVNKLKIDGSFIRHLQANRSDPIVSTIISMGKNLDLIVLAECIETKAQLEYLQQLGCHFGQGFYLGIPMPPEQLHQQIFGESTS